MPLHQQHDRLPGFVVKLQSAQHFVRHFLTDGPVSVKVTRPILVHCKAFLLSNVVKKHEPTVVDLPAEME